MKITAFAPINIALLKYWGKSNIDLNEPTHSSISVTLDVGTTTTIESGDFSENIFYLNKIKNENANSWVKLNKIINKFNLNSDLKFIINSTNDVPTGSGLASSASGLAAFTLALSKFDSKSKSYSIQDLAAISRIGSGSSCRSFLDDFVSWNVHDKKSVSISQIIPDKDFKLDATILVFDHHLKSISSTEGMLVAQKTSPVFSDWISSAKKSYDEFYLSIKNSDFEKLAELSENNCQLMHSTTKTAKPPFSYFTKNTVESIILISELRRKGTAVFYTIDAGPNVVCFTLPSHTAEFRNKLNDFPKHKRLTAKMGKGARIL